MTNRDVKMPACTLSRIVFHPTVVNLAVNDTRLLNAVGLDKIGVVQHGTTFTGTSDNTAIATESAAGVVTAVKKGKCNIRATSGSIKGNILVQVGSVGKKVMNEDVQKDIVAKR